MAQRKEIKVYHPDKFTNEQKRHSIIEGVKKTKNYLTPSNIYSNLSSSSKILNCITLCSIYVFSIEWCDTKL